MSQVGTGILHTWQDGEIVTGQNMNMNQELLRVALNDADTKANANATSITNMQTSKANQTDLTSLQTQVNTNTTTIAQKADKTYVDAQVAAIQNGQIADNAVSTQKIQNQAVTQAKIANQAVGTQQIANLAVTLAQVDGVTVYTAAQVNTQITNTTGPMQTQINSNTTQLTTLQNQLNNLQYNKDLDMARMDILALDFAVTNLQNATVAGMTGNIVLENFKTITDWNLIAGIYDGTNYNVHI